MADGVQIFRSDEDLLRDSAEHGRPSRERYSDTFEGGDDELRTVSRSSSTASFVIAAETLSSPSPRPRHLESRLESRNPLHYSAESNRNAFLEERRARLRQHLNRIDEVLERNQRRLDDEVSLKRDSLTQKLRDVERNRLKLHEQKHLSAKRLRQRTTSSVADGAGEPPAAATNEKAKREEAASILQAVWRQQKYRQLVAEMSRRKLSLGSIKGLSFMDLVGKIQQPSTNKSMARFLLGIRAASAESSRIDFKNPARVFLSAYVIVSHPSEIIHSEGPAESELKECAQRMLDAFERLSADTGSGTAAAKVFSDALLVFVGRWVEYYRAFDAWKQADTHKIVGELIAHWLELERLWLSVRAEMHADSEWRGRVEHQQEQIRTRISKIAGEAGIARLVEESRRSRAEMGLGDEVEDDLESPAVPKLEDGPGVDNVPSSPPRTASVPGSAPGTPPRKSSTGPYSSSPSRFPSSMEKRAMAKLSDSVTNSRAGSATGTPTRNLSRTSSIAEPMASSSGQPSPSAQGMQLDDMGQFFGGLGATMGSNEQLAHELVMNPDFQLQPSKRSPLEESIRTAARKAFFDSIREDFAKGDYSRFALGLIDEAKNAIAAMLREDGKVLQEVNEVLDLPLISQQISNGVYDFRSTTGYILGKMAQLCAPARDPVVRELVSTVETDLAATWDGVLRLLDDMKLDLANFRLQQLRPQLKLQAVEYERRKFDEGLECGRFSLERTKTWLESTSRNLLALAASRNPEKVDIPEAAPRFEDVYHEALLSLVFGTTAVNIANCPETLMLDAERIFAMQNDGQAATIVAALLILAKNMVPELRSNDAAAARLKQRLMTLLKDPEGGVTVENLSAELVASMNSVLAAKPRPPDVPEAKLGAEQEMMVKNMVDKTLAYRDAVFAMMQRRMQDKVRQTLQSSSLPTPQSLASSGLDAVAQEVVDLCRRVARLAEHDREVHARHYDAVIRECLLSLS